MTMSTSPATPKDKATPTKPLPKSTTNTLNTSSNNINAINNSNKTNVTKESKPAPGTGQRTNTNEYSQSNKSNASKSVKPSLSRGAGTALSPTSPTAGAPGAPTSATSAAVPTKGTAPRPSAASKATTATSATSATSATTTPIATNHASTSAKKGTATNPKTAANTANTANRTSPTGLASPSNQSNQSNQSSRKPSSTSTLSKPANVKPTKTTKTTITTKTPSKVIPKSASKPPSKVKVVSKTPSKPLSKFTTKSIGSVGSSKSKASVVSGSSSASKPKTPKTKTGLKSPSGVTAASAKGAVAGKTTGVTPSTATKTGVKPAGKSAAKPAAKTTAKPAIKPVSKVALKSQAAAGPAKPKAPTAKAAASSGGVKGGTSQTGNDGGASSTAATMATTAASAQAGSSAAASSASAASAASAAAKSPAAPGSFRPNAAIAASAANEPAPAMNTNGNGYDDVNSATESPNNTSNTSSNQKEIEGKSNSPLDVLQSNTEGEESNPTAQGMQDLFGKLSSNGLANPFGAASLPLGQLGLSGLSNMNTDDGSNLSLNLDNFGSIGGDKEGENPSAPLGSNVSPDTATTTATTNVANLTNAANHPFYSSLGNLSNPSSISNLLGNASSTNNLGTLNSFNDLNNNNLNVSNLDNANPNSNPNGTSTNHPPSENNAANDSTSNDNNLSGNNTRDLSLDWIQHYIELQHYYAQNGNCRVSSKGPLKNKDLSKWVHRQKKEYRRWKAYQERKQDKSQDNPGNKGSQDESTSERPLEMTEERIRLLENVGLEWDYPPKKDSKRSSSRRSGEGRSGREGKDGKERKDRKEKRSGRSREREKSRSKSRSGRSKSKSSKRKGDAASYGLTLHNLHPALVGVATDGSGFASGGGIAGGVPGEGGLGMEGWNSLGLGGAGDGKDGSAKTTEMLDSNVLGMKAGNMPTGEDGFGVGGPIVAMMAGFNNDPNNAMGFSGMGDNCKNNDPSQMKSSTKNNASQESSVSSRRDRRNHPTGRSNDGNALPSNPHGSHSTHGSHGLHQSHAPATGEWKDRYEDLIQFQLEHGHTRVPEPYPPNLALGLWVKDQRQQYKWLQKGKTSRMTNHRVKLLNDIGFEWQVAEMSEWKKRYRELQLFKSRFGHCRVPRDYPQENSGVTGAFPSGQLGLWCQQQRDQKRLFDEGKTSNMTPERISMLNGVGFEWDSASVIPGVGSTGMQGMQGIQDMSALASGVAMPSGGAPIKGISFATPLFPSSNAEKYPSKHSEKNDLNPHSIAPAASSNLTTVDTGKSAARSDSSSSSSSYSPRHLRKKRRNRDSENRGSRQEQSSRNHRLDRGDRSSSSQTSTHNAERASNHHHHPQLMMLGTNDVTSQAHSRSHSKESKKKKKHKKKRSKDSSQQNEDERESREGKESRKSSKMKPPGENIASGVVAKAPFAQMKTSGQEGLGNSMGIDSIHATGMPESSIANPKSTGNGGDSINSFPWQQQQQQQEQSKMPPSSHQGKSLSQSHLLNQSQQNQSQNSNMGLESFGNMVPPNQDPSLPTSSAASFFPQQSMQQSGLVDALQAQLNPSALVNSSQQPVPGLNNFFQNLNSGIPQSVPGPVSQLLFGSSQSKDSKKKKKKDKKDKKRSSTQIEDGQEKRHKPCKDPNNFDHNTNQKEWSMASSLPTSQAAHYGTKNMEGQNGVTENNPLTNGETSGSVFLNSINNNHNSLAINMPASNADGNNGNNSNNFDSNAAKLPTFISWQQQQPSSILSSTPQMTGKDNFNGTMPAQAEHTMPNNPTPTLSNNPQNPQSSQVMSSNSFQQQAMQQQAQIQALQAQLMQMTSNFSPGFSMPMSSNSFAMNGGVGMDQNFNAVLPPALQQMLSSLQMAQNQQLQQQQDPLQGNQQVPPQIAQQMAQLGGIPPGLGQPVPAQLNQQELPLGVQPFSMATGNPALSAVGQQNMMMTGQQMIAPNGQFAGPTQLPNKDKPTLNESGGGKSDSNKESEPAKPRATSERTSTGKGEQWYKRYNELKEYRARHGNCNVPKRYSDNPALGTWVSNQRSLRRLLNEGKSSHMTPERIQLLEQIGFDWHPPGGPNAKQEEQWNHRYQELDAYRQEKGNCRVPTKNYPPNPALGQWVNDQRRQYRLLKQGKNSSMTQDRITRLEAIGFEWSAPTHPRAQDQWKVKYEELSTYKQHHGNCLVPTRYESNPALGRWVGIQRREYQLYLAKQASTLTKDKIDKLNYLGFEWTVPSRNAQSGNMESSSTSNLTNFAPSTGFNNGVITGQNEGNIAGQMVHQGPGNVFGFSEYGQAIGSTGTIGNGMNDALWLQRYEELRQYHQRFGNVVVSLHSTQYPELCRFVEENKADFLNLILGKPTQLTKERMELLSQVGFEWPFLSTNANFQVPNNGPSTSQNQLPTEIVVPQGVDRKVFNV